MPAGRGAYPAGTSPKGAPMGRFDELLQQQKEIAASIGLEAAKGRAAAQGHALLQTGRNAATP